MSNNTTHDERLKNRSDEMNAQLTRRAMLGKTATAAVAAVGVQNWVFSIGSDGNIVKAQSRGKNWKPDFFSRKEITQIELLCETIIPKTDTAGASEARVHEYIDLLYSVDTKANQGQFRDGLKWLDRRCKKLYKTNIVKSTPDTLHTLLEPVSDLHDSHAQDLRLGVELFRNLKSKTITGYYTSKEGRVQELGLPEHMMMTSFNGCTHTDGEH